MVLDWDAFMAPAAALAGREITGHRDTWPAYRQLVRTLLEAIAHHPVVLLGVGTPDELDGWPIDAWVLLDCTDEERRRRLAPLAGPDRLAEGIHDAAEDRSLGLPVIDTTGHAAEEVAANLASSCDASNSVARRPCLPITFARVTAAHGRRCAARGSRSARAVRMTSLRCARCWLTNR